MPKPTSHEPEEGQKNYYGNAPIGGCEQSIQFYNKYHDNMSKKFKQDFPKHVHSDHFWDFVVLMKYYVIIKKSGTILDAGCGPGHITSYLSNQSQQFLPEGVDLSEEMISEARNGYPRLRFKNEDTRTLNSIHDNRYDGIIVPHSLIHIPKRQIHGSLMTLNRVLKRQGIIYMSVQGSEKIEECKEGLYPHPLNNEPIFLNIFSINELVIEIERAGFKIILLDKRRPDEGEHNFMKFIAIACKD
jgi:ubiquinone/menaquinone biosynthesis C-methylase UbiE